MYAEIIINSNARALNRIFDYIIPKEMETSIKVGSRIFVPFGNGKKLEDGFVIGIKETSEFANKEIAKIDEQESLSEENVILAKLMARKYFCNISDCIKLMLPPGTGAKEIENRTKEKTGNFVYLQKTKEEIEKELAEGTIKSEKQQRALKVLIKTDGIYISDLEEIADVSKSILQTLNKNNYIKFVSEQIKRNPFINKNIERDFPKKLNEEQERCFNGINFCIENSEFSSNLIFGITGSGKTEIYLQLIASAIKQNKMAIVLVPEISLTPQMVDRFLARFGNQVAVLHSKLSIGERFDEWQKIKNGEVKIVIGARSAIFAPVKNLGIIIIDEEHDMSYKSEMTPRYDAKDIAKYIAEKSNCPLVLGSATPEITTFYHAKNRDIELYKLTKRANNARVKKFIQIFIKNFQNGRGITILHK